VKNTDDSQFGEHVRRSHQHDMPILIPSPQSWTFRHPDFHADRRDCLENIKRKVPAQRKSVGITGQQTTATSPGPLLSSPTGVDALQAQVDRLTQSQEEMTSNFRNLEQNYQDVLSEMINFQRTMAQQDQLMQNLISYFLQVENGEWVKPSSRLLVLQQG
jgi:osomolarity two-component system, response regulator SKN7